MTPRRAILGWLVALVVTFLVAVAGAGCSKQIPKCPEPTAAYTAAWCFAGVRKGADFVACSPSKDMCEYVTSRLIAFNDIAKLGVESLSGCAMADVSVTVK